MALNSYCFIFSEISLKLSITYIKSWPPDFTKLKEIYLITFGNLLTNFWTICPGSQMFWGPIVHRDQMSRNQWRGTKWVTPLFYHVKSTFLLSFCTVIFHFFRYFYERITVKKPLQMKFFHENVTVIFCCKNINKFETFK